MRKLNWLSPSIGELSQNFKKISRLFGSAFLPRNPIDNPYCSKPFWPFSAKRADRHLPARANPGLPRAAINPAAYRIIGQAARLVSVQEQNRDRVSMNHFGESEEEHRRLKMPIIAKVLMFSPEHLR
jgi:hypothetical protein